MVLIAVFILHAHSPAVFYQDPLHAAVQEHVAPMSADGIHQRLTHDLAASPHIVRHVYCIQIHASGQDGEGEPLRRHSHKAPVSRQTELQFPAFEKFIQHVLGAPDAVLCQYLVDLRKSRLSDKLLQLRGICRACGALCQEIRNFLVEFPDHVEITPDGLRLLRKFPAQQMASLLLIRRKRHSPASRQVDLV